MLNEEGRRVHNGTLDIERKRNNGGEAVDYGEGEAPRPSSLRARMAAALIIKIER